HRSAVLVGETEVDLQGRLAVAIELVPQTYAAFRIWNLLGMVAQRVASGRIADKNGYLRLLKELLSDHLDVPGGAQRRAQGVVHMLPALRFLRGHAGAGEAPRVTLAGQRIGQTQIDQLQGAVHMPMVADRRIAQHEGG